MTDPNDLPALLAEWTRVHEAARSERWAADCGGVVYIDDGSEHPDFVCEPSGYRASEPERRLCIDEAIAIAHYHNTYGALLNVVRELIGDRDRARAEAANAANSDSAREAHAYNAFGLTLTLARLTRAAREADGGVA